ncbi:reticulon-1 isoform A [Mus musculus]|uniref:Reticulon-1 n=3 Tax=Mus musculus TaxID=10090 RepID=RTN1_MOUSE|nr:reticulon-1 isoform A [Mus musculus]Q8K0T0.1 RecName: Full=Reticulon-1; AltName: Full=Neuroendocrine-specific protein [Mus musculus]AAH30455.1 Reticulon 1 [Mus musculus]AAH53926.1 Reticulon 1 [Mus musculus]AAH58579.1 Reticulon 1 [Mus musculus]EDL36535.1 reticulon 1, isoform CRA_a [Mus musculus]CAJ18599.1 Rtn1 [Mus musculus]|eukprot:NP_703187.2 reticulon-1 isoform A [Mus musculus]
MAAPPDLQDEPLSLGSPGSQWFGGRGDGEDEATAVMGARPAQQDGEPAWGSGAGAGVTSSRELCSGPARSPPVAMETASTGMAAVPDALDHSPSSTLKDGEGACYTSLISDVCYPPREDSAYFTGILQKENGHITTSESPEEPETPGPSLPEVPGMEPQGLLSSDSGIEMTPAESTEVNKILADPLDQMKAEAYKYIDITRPQEAKGQEEQHPGLEDKDLDFKDKDTEVSTKAEGVRAPNQPAPVEGKLIKDHLFEESTFAPYIDELSDEQHRVSLVTAPVKITLTEIEPPLMTATQETIPEKQDLCLKPSPDTVPTVTVSEPEDDSPGSVTPPSSGTEPSAAESQGKGSVSEDELIAAIKEAKGLSYETTESPRPVGQVADKPKTKTRSGLPTIPSPLDQEASSAESGDSEIELVSEDPMASEDALPSGYVSFGHVSGPPPSPASPSIQYSILREEREAELDSELIIESCDASSASEESPKREQDSPPMKPGALDAIREETGSRATEERAPSHQGPVEPDPMLSFAPAAALQSRPEPSSGDGASVPEPPRSQQQKPEEEAVSSSQSPTATEIPGPLGSGLMPPLPFFNKQKAIDLLYWRDIKQTGIVFGSFLLLLFSLTQFSVVSVVAYLALAALSATISFRIYKSVLQAVQKTDEGHPFKAYLELEITLSQEQIQKYTDCLQLYVNSTLKELRRLFLVQDLVDSLKFAVLMWLLTYVGALFNGLTLLLMAVVSMFTLPVVYVKHQAQVDQYLGLVRTHINTVVAKIQAKIPGAKRHAE